MNVDVQAHDVQVLPLSTREHRLRNATMALNNSRKSLIEWRRDRVADGLRYGHSQRTLAAQLQVSVATINHDVKVLSERWRAAAGVDIAEHRAKQLAEIYTLKQAAWRRGAHMGEPKQARIMLQAI